MMTAAYRSFEEASGSVMSFLLDYVEADTLFIALLNGAMNRICEAVNRGRFDIRAGSVRPLVETYCHLIIHRAEQMLNVADTTAHPDTASLPVTAELGPAAFSGVAVNGTDGQPLGSIGALRDPGAPFSERDIRLMQSMAALLGYVASLESVAFRDPLTGLYSRLYLTRRFAESAAAAADDAADVDPAACFTTGPLALLFIDVDNFKMVNDQYGHEAGDQVLRGIADTIARIGGASSIGARIGGDEFLLILREDNGSPLAEHVAGSILAELRCGIPCGPVSLPMTASIGISRVLPGLTFEEVLRSADQAMYRVKHNGKAGFAVLPANQA